MRRIAKDLRTEDKPIYEGDAQQILRAKDRKPAKQQGPPIKSDPANEAPEHWNAVLASHGLYEPDKRVMGWRWKKPTYTFSWPVMQSADEKEAAWGFTFSWGEFFESFQTSTEDPERFKGFVAHVPTMGDVDRAVDGGPKSAEYLRPYA